jgi:molecular chaperone GrpE
MARGKKQAKTVPADDTPAADAVERRAEAPEGGGPPEGSPEPGPRADLVEPLEEAVKRLQSEIDDLRDRLLRTAAEFDNYRKRTARERAETWNKAQAELVSVMVDAIDDLSRVTALDLATADAGDILTGVEMVERKLTQQLEQAGLERVGRAEEPFDPSHHEAVGAVPAPSPAHDGMIADVLQTGYRMGPTLIRPARVRVFVAQPAPSPDGGSA